MGSIASLDLSGDGTLNLCINLTGEAAAAVDVAVAAAAVVSVVAVCADVSNKRLSQGACQKTHQAVLA
jgi:hypothetical protein